MFVQFDLVGGMILCCFIEMKGIDVCMNVWMMCFDLDVFGVVVVFQFQDGSMYVIDIVVFIVGVWLQDIFVWYVQFVVYLFGGVLIDFCCCMVDEYILVIGEVVNFEGCVVGFVVFGYVMVEVVVMWLFGGDVIFFGFDDLMKFKFFGVDVVSFGDVMVVMLNVFDVVYIDLVNGVYKKFVFFDDVKILFGGILVGDVLVYGLFCFFVGVFFGGDFVVYLMFEGGVVFLDDELFVDVVVCLCLNVMVGCIWDVVYSDGCVDVVFVKVCIKVGVICGFCLFIVKKIVGQEFVKLGQVMLDVLCEYFVMLCCQLFDVVCVFELLMFSVIIVCFGIGWGCDVCKFVFVSILVVFVGDYVFDGENVVLQDINDYVMVNMQKDGIYLVVLCMLGGEVIFVGFIVIGSIVEFYGFYMKIIGGQWIDMFGVWFEQFLQIWWEFVDVGFELGQVYGKVLCIVKLCVGLMWCCYGVLDVVGMVVCFELWY